MPLHANKYMVNVRNRFLLDSAGESSGSDDDAPAHNVDPYQMVKKAETDAVKQVKLKAREAARTASATKIIKPVEEVPQENQNKPVVDSRRQTNRKDPRANNAPRYGRRNQETQDNALTESNRGQQWDNNANPNSGPVEQNENNRRNTRRLKTQDRQSGNPRSGVRAQVKKGGAGQGNWGVATDQGNYEKDEQLTPEENDNTENNDPAMDGDNEEEEAEDQEPPVVQVSLEEYYAAVGDQIPESNTRKYERKANDGEVLKGNLIKPQKTHTERKQVFHRDVGSNKNIISNDQVGFISGAGRGYNYNNDGERRSYFTDGGRGGRGRGGRGGGRGRGGRGGYNNRDNGGNREKSEQQNTEFSFQTEEYPVLGQKV